MRGTGRTDADGRRSCPTNANRCVAQDASPAGIRRKKGTTLKRSNGWQEWALPWFDRLRGRRLFWWWVPQVSLRATQRLAIVGRFHPPAWWGVCLMCGNMYGCDTQFFDGLFASSDVNPRLMNHIVGAGQTHRSAPTLICGMFPGCGGSMHPGAIPWVIFRNVLYRRPSGS